MFKHSGRTCWRGFFLYAPLYHIVLCQAVPPVSDCAWFVPFHGLPTLSKTIKSSVKCILQLGLCLFLLSLILPGRRRTIKPQIYCLAGVALGVRRATRLGCGSLNQVILRPAPAMSRTSSHGLCSPLVSAVSWLRPVVLSNMVTATILWSCPVALARPQTDSFASTPVYVTVRTAGRFPPIYHNIVIRLHYQ